MKTFVSEEYIAKSLSSFRPFHPDYLAPSDQ